MAAARLAALLAGALVLPAMAGAPAQGDLLDPVTGAVSGTTGGVLDATGWLYDDSQASMDHVRSVIGAETMWSRGYTGQGVGVALIDTGVVPVKGLMSGNVVDGADLSFESQSEDLRHYDTFGHGTHMAGIIAGDEPQTLLGPAPFRGVAPDAELTSIKVGAHDGAVDVSQVVAAVDWVVEHRNDDPKNPIRVLNLSYGTDGVQGYRVDPLTHAVENAWRAGIVVVVSGGNEGFGHGKLNNPAYDPRVLAVGAADTKGTTSTLDDTVPEFSSRGDAQRRVDLTAPGRSIVSLRDPGSYLDEAHPGARVGDRFFKGSGSSQAAAVVAGAVALLLDQRPGLSPDQVKALLRKTAAAMPTADAAGRGAGEINLAAARTATAPTGTQSWAPSTGTGSLEQARGTQHVADNGVELTGERDILAPWKPARWAKASSSGTAWEGGRWNGTDWTGTCWCDSTWSGRAWAARSWSARSWSGDSWEARSWSARSWSARSWSGDAWEARSWSARSWSGSVWN
ncbi:MAG: S8 family serine peptidase [Actinomycetota bacterium]|nr:S8 family serine peptidase [Actinomycetota bacterium]